MCSCICSIIEPGLCEGRLFVCGLFHPNEIVCGITAQLCFRNCANTGISVGARNRIRRKCGENIPVTGGTDLERSTLGNSNRMRFAIPPIGNLAARIRMPIVIRHRPVALVVQSITCTPCDDIVDRNIDFRNAQFQCSGIPISVRQRSCFWWKTKAADRSIRHTLDRHCIRIFKLDTCNSEVVVEIETRMIVLAGKGSGIGVCSFILPRYCYLELEEFLIVDRIHKDVLCKIISPVDLACDRCLFRCRCLSGTANSRCRSHKKCLQIGDFTISLCNGRIRLRIVAQQIIDIIQNCYFST